MKKPNWDKILKNIPSRVQVGNKRWFEVVWIDEFKDPTIHGETRFNPDQIVLAKKWGTREKVYTFFHEYIHAVDSVEAENPLSEKQVAKHERKLLYYMKFFDKLLKE